MGTRQASVLGKVRSRATAILASGGDHNANHHEAIRLLMTAEDELGGPAVRAIAQGLPWGPPHTVECVVCMGRHWPRGLGRPFTEKEMAG